MRHKRAIFRGRAANINRERFVFLDETGVNTAMTRLYARAAVGQRVVDTVPQGSWETTTLLSAINTEGVVSAVAFPGATDSLAFASFVEHHLLPVLQPGDIMVLDNLKPHKQPQLARLLRRAGVGVWYLPPYSPDYNPIELIFSKVKRFLRRVATRSTAALWEALGEALATVTAQDCQNCFAHCGYTATSGCNML